MSLNWREIDLVLEELNLPGSHVQQIIQPDFRNIYFQIYRPGNRFWLRVCLQTGETRLHESSTGAKKPKTRQRFVQLLQARIKGARIVAAEQVNSDRIVRLELAAGGETTLIWIRLWGGAANILFTDADGLIIDAFFRRPARGEVSGRVFQVPEPGKPAKPFESRFGGTERPGESGGISRKIESFYENRSDEAEHKRLLQTVRKDLSGQCVRLSSQLQRAEETLQDAASAERYQVQGDIIMSNLHRIDPGDRWLEAEDYTNEDAALSIELDPGLTPQANAETYYKNARRARRRLGAQEEETQNLRSRIAQLENTLSELDDADLDTLRHIASTLVPASRRKSGPEPGAPSGPTGLQFKSGGFQILVGRNARENDNLLRRHVRGNDLWLHTRDYPGGYVFIRAQKNKSVPLEVLLDAGTLAVHFSRARPNGRAELYYTQVKHLRRVKNGPTGLVLPTHEKNLSIVVDQARLARLRG